MVDGRNLPLFPKQLGIGEAEARRQEPGALLLEHGCGDPSARTVFGFPTCISRELDPLVALLSLLCHSASPKHMFSRQ